MRKAEVRRTTKETDISISLDVDGRGACAIDCPEGFLAHMLDALARFSLIDLGGRIAGDLGVDEHHTVEDTGFVLGQALRQALGDMAGLRRCGSAYFPMDEALARACLDISGRPFCLVRGKERAMPAGAFSRQLFEEFFQGFCRGAGATLHLDLLRGRNGHHIYEAGFKAFARALMEAVSIMERAPRAAPSTKGSIEGYPRAGEAAGS